MTQRQYLLDVTANLFDDTRVLLAVPGSAHLEQLHEVIVREFDLDPLATYAFYLSGVVGDERSAFVGPGDEQGERPMSAARVDQLALRAGARLAHAAVDADAALSVRVREVREGAGSEIEIVERGYGEQRGAERAAAIEKAVGVGRRANELRQARPSIADDVDAAAAEAALAWATRAFDAMEAEQGLAYLIDQESDELGLAEWLSQAARALFTVGRVDDALALTKRAGKVLELPEFGLFRAALCAQAAREDAARVAIESVLLARPHAASIVLDCAQLLASCGDPERAAALAREVLESNWDPELVEMAGEVLARALAATEQREAAHAAIELGKQKCLERAQRHVRRHLEAFNDIGRNDSCPCGSDAKFKKCCGAAGARRETEWRACTVLMERLAEASSREWLDPRGRLELFGGPEFAGVDVLAALALFHGDDSDAVFELWWTLDSRGADGQTAVERRLAAGDATELERGIAERLAGSHLDLYRVEDADEFQVVLRSLLDESAPIVRVDAAALRAQQLGDLVAVRVIELDGEAVVLPGVVTYASGDEAELVRRLSSERDAWRAAHPADDTARFLAENGHLFHRLARDLELSES